MSKQTGWTDTSLSCMVDDHYTECPICGIDTATVQIVQAGSTGIKVLMDEGNSKDSEINHTTEVVGFLTLVLE